jgi:hypothetical protein
MNDVTRPMQIRDGSRVEREEGFEQEKTETTED